MKIDTSLMFDPVKVSEMAGELEDAGFDGDVRHANGFLNRRIVQRNLCEGWLNIHVKNHLSDTWP